MKKHAKILYCAMVIAGAMTLPAIPVHAKGNGPIQPQPSILPITTDSIKTLSLLTFPFRNQYNDPHIDELIKYARQYTGAPYKWGSKGPNRFDCSGFTQYVFKNFSYPLNGSSSLQSQQGISVENQDIRRGDLVFFKGRNARQNRVRHVGIVTEVFDDGSFKFIHASISTGVREDVSTKPYYATRFMGARRIIAPTLPANWFLENILELDESYDNSPFALDQ